jgi:hypothetical protein
MLLTGTPTECLSSRAGSQFSDINHLGHSLRESLLQRLPGYGCELVKSAPVELAQSVFDFTGSEQSVPWFRRVFNRLRLYVAETSDSGLLPKYRGSLYMEQKIGQSVTARKYGLVWFSDYRE